MSRTEERLGLSEYLSTRQRKSKACWHEKLDPGVVEQVNANLDTHQWTAIAEWLSAETGQKFTSYVIVRHSRKCV